MPRVRVTKDWDAAMADHVEFARTFLVRPDGTHFEPHDAQQTILNGIQRRTVLDTGRQFGKTETLAALAIEAAVKHPGWEVAIVAPSLEQARIVFNLVHTYLLQKPLSYFVAGKIKEYPFPLAKFKNGASITARGANSPQFIRGNRWHYVLVDEAAQVRDETITSAIEPTMTVRGKEPGAAMVLASTPFGSGPFKDWYDEAQQDDHDPDLAAFHYTSYDNPYADHKYLDKVKARYGENSLVWLSEYLGLFPDDDLAVFPWQDILWATDNYPFKDKENGAILFPIPFEDGHRYVQGADLANLRDYFVSTVGDITDPHAVPLVRMDRYQKRGYTAVKQTIRANSRDYGNAKTLIDATTLAESVVEDLQAMGVNAEGYKFSGSTAKYEVVQELARMLSEHRLLLPPERVIIDELHYFTYEITPSKRLRMEASQGNDDVVMSLSLLAHLANLPRRLGLFRSVSVTPTKLPARSLGSWADAFNEDNAL